jgi:polyhydroxyalkanoate synthesis regulator phasin
MAIAAGATDELVDLVVERMVSERKIRPDRAKELIDEFKAKGKL